MHQPTDDQIIDEARRRRHQTGIGPGANLGAAPLAHFIIEVVREGWTPPEPDADEAIERLTAQLNHLVSLESVGVMVKTADLAAVLVRAARVAELEARVAELEAALAKANAPRWFYSDEEGTLWHSAVSVEDCIEDLEPGRFLVEIETARPRPTSWGVVHIFTETEIEDQHRDGGPFEGASYKLTVCATEAEARALLKEPEQ